MNELQEQCIKAAIDYGIAAYEVISDSQRSNKLYDLSRKLFVTLKKQPDGIQGLYELLNHEHPYVKYIAAIYLLAVDEPRAKQEINSLVGFSRHLDFSIKYLLIEWDNGNLKEYYS